MNAPLTSSENKLPDFMRKAHLAVSNNIEVQDMIRRLADFGLAVTIPHIHTTEEEFAPMPEGLVQVETNMVVSIAKRDGFADASYIPVSWRWTPSGGISAAGECSSYSFCSPGPMVHSPISGHSSASRSDGE